ncbi:MAG: hypothetical protein HYX28_04780 [Candidatus Koribacter versatilis]|uniref:Uncharacterized protein n=1 Tax=Candidatus Korobacter versatilis TaxID=658062 RepID=A0A932EPU4_9BACT|nr:hypothetical protein [Candidatus Koribacter versatilis]
MRRTRYMSWLFLALSIGFFFMQDFRWALAMPMMQYRLQQGDAAALNATQSIGADRIRALADRARADGDANGLAFAALHWPGDDPQEALNLADAAVIKDPAKGWVYSHVAFRYLGKHDSPTIDELAKKSMDYDSNNAISYLLMAEIYRRRDAQPVHLTKVKDRYQIELLGGKKDWLGAMQGAFNAPQYDGFAVPRFLTERAVLKREHWENPSTLVLLIAEYPIPNLLDLSNYARYRMQSAIDKNADGKHNAELIHDGYLVYRFGHLMENGAASSIEEILGRAVQNIAYEPLHDALRSTKNEDAVIALNLDHQRAQFANNEFRHVLNRRSNTLWSGVVIMVCASLTAVFALLTLLCLAYVNLKRWVRSDRQGRIFNIVTMAENYMPILLFLSSYTMFMFYIPYASNFRAYMNAEGDMRSLEPLMQNVYPLIGIDPYEAAPVHPFGSYLYWVVVCFVAVGGAILMKRFYSAESKIMEHEEHEANAAGAGE